ncbi:MAG: AIM24 family protein [Curvibacter sp.]|nr:MAG: AIM24 family protein [Curvibacter sp.]
MAMDVVDYQIFGSEMQYVEVELDPGEAAIGEAGVMMYMQEGITMDTIFGDGSQQGGFFGKLMGAGKRLLTGEGLFTTVFENSGSGKQRVAFAAPYPGKIVPMDLSQLGGTLNLQENDLSVLAMTVEVATRGSA